MVADTPPLFYPNAILCARLYPCVCIYLCMLTNLADVVGITVLCFIMVTNITSNTYHLAQLACFVRVVRVFCLVGSSWM